MSNFVDDAIKLMLVLHFKQSTLFCSLVCGVLSPWKVLPSPKKAVNDPFPKHLKVAVDDPLPKHLLLVSEVPSVQLLTKSLKEVVSDPTWVINNNQDIVHADFYLFTWWVQSTVATRHGKC